MLFLAAFGACFLGLVFGEDPVTLTLPIQYITENQQTLDRANDVHILIASLNCTSLVSASVDICAELPNNWKWKPERGVVYINVYDNLADTNDLSKAKWSNGKPGTGMEPQNKCINITRWPGQGDLYIRIDPDRYYPITYTLSALVTPVPAPMRGLYTPPSRPRQIAAAPVNAAGLMNPKTTKQIYLIPTSITTTSLELEFDHEMLVSLDVCVDPNRPAPHFQTSLIVEGGTLTQYLCDRLPCNVNSHNVKCSVETPLPVSTCDYQLQPGQPKSYIYLHAAGGEKNASGKYVTTFSVGVAMR